MEFDIYEHRQDATQASWELPPWGHPLGLFALPLFVTFEERYVPVGTAFRVGEEIAFVLTANHNIREALKLEGRFDRELTSTQLPSNIDLRRAGLCVLQQVIFEGTLRLTFTPLENVHGAPPTDVVFGYPTYERGRPFLTFPIRFDPPRIGDVVWSIGYTDIKPENGFSFDDVTTGRFNLESYSHRFVVAEGRVIAIFTQGFAKSFPTGPCFAFDCDIPSGLSGGPVLSNDCNIIGMNSAGASTYFNTSMSLGSMLFPLLLTPVKFGAKFQFAPEFSLTLNGTRKIIDLIGQGVIRTDGSEANVSLRKTEEGGWALGFAGQIADRDRIHDDFAGYQARTPASTQKQSVYRLKRRPPPD